MPTLRIIDGFGAGFALDLPGRITVGRDPSNQVQIGDPKASRIHAEILPNGTGWMLRDLGSSNGTWTDAGGVQELSLAGGATFRIGRTYLRFEDGEAADLGATILGDEGGWRDPDHVEGLGAETILLRRNKETADEDDAELRRSNDYLILLHQIVLRSNQAEGREQLFELLDDVAADALESDRCAVFLPTPDGWTLWPPHERRLRARFGATPFARSLLTQVRARLEPLLCTQEGDLTPTTSMVQAGMPSAMAAPLRLRDEVHALLYVDRLSGHEVFTRTDLEFLAAVANQLAVRLHNCDAVAQLAAEVDRLSAQTPPNPVLDLIGKDPGLEGVRRFVAKVAPTPTPVLITGESGTGKELVARAVHAGSRRSDKPMQVVNCAAMAESLVEATLFGHVKGAYTGADGDRPGLFELADQGTLFLDEVGELPLAVQAKLLRVLEQGEVQRLGENRTRTVDVRLITATNRDLTAEVKAGRYREDLLHRLDVLHVALPPLRERPGDIDLLIDHFLAVCARKLEQKPKRLAPETRALLLRYHWPGNIRQLRNVVERACIMAGSEVIRPEDLPESVRGGTEVASFMSPIVSMAEVEKMHILRVLEHTGGNKKGAAELLGIDRSTLYAKLRQYGVK